MNQLRPYQVNAINTLAQKVSKGKRKLIFQLATGGGKTVTFAGLVQRFLAKQQKKILILVHREELLKQARRTIYEWTDIVSAPVVAGVDYLPNTLVYIAMVETANNRLKKNPNYFGDIGLVIVDECHLGNFKKLYSFFPRSLIIGFTATPISSSKKDPLKNHFDDIVCGIDIPDLITSGSLVKNKTYHIENVKRKDLAVKNGEFDERQMASVYSGTKHVQNCIAAYKKYAFGTKTLVFNCNIEHSKKVNGAFQAFGYPSRHLDGETSDAERTDTLKWFHNTPGAILNNVGVLTTGFDEPSVQTVIVNKSTKSEPLWLQMTGRGSRLFPGKDFYTIVDMGGNAMELGDWCNSRNWADKFFHPDKPSEGGEAPQKVCVGPGCGVLIHLSQKICPHCGALNQRVVKYDEAPIKLELLNGQSPIIINVAALVNEYSGKKKADGTPYNEHVVLHVIKRELISHVRYKWRLKSIDDKTAYKLLDNFQDKVREWCAIREKKYSRWYQNTSREWLFAEFKTVFKWEPAGSVIN